MTESSIVTLIVAGVGALGAIAASVSSVLVRTTRREQFAFQQENTEQHGKSMEAITEIQLITRETQIGVRELKADLSDHLLTGHKAKK